MNNDLLEESHIRWQSKMEKDAFKKLKTRRFIHTTMYDPLLLQATSMDTELTFIFQVVSWDGFWNIAEQESKLLTLEFLCTLQITDSRVKFRFFGKEYSSPGKDLSLLLGSNLDHALQDFDKLKFWREIFEKTDFSVPVSMTFNIPHFISCING